MTISPINHENPIKVYPDGSYWCALVGLDLQEGESGFGKSPEQALEALLSKEEVWAATPHATYQLQCSGCNYQWVAVMPYPNQGQAECPKCSALVPVSSDPIGDEDDAE